MASSTLPSTTIDTTENMETKVLSILSETYPNLDCGPGTPIYEMVVRPTAMLWSRQASGIEELLDSVSFQGYPTKSTEILDRLMNRYFLTRRTGEYVTGIVRVVYAAQIDVYLAAGEVVEASDDRYYEIVSDHFITSAELEGDDVNGYHVDITVQSLGKGSAYNAYENESVTITGNSGSGVRRAYFIADTSNGGVIESNYVFYNRGKDELALRGLFAYKTTKSILRENFDTIQQVVPVGIRDDEMVRDLVTIRGYGTVHIGGKCDIYIRPDTFKVSQGYTAPLGFPMSFNGTSITDEPAELMNTWNQAGIMTGDVTTRGSLEENIPMLTSGSNMTTLTCDLQPIDDFVNNSENELFHTDNMVKQMWPIVFTAKIKIYDQDSAAAIAAAKIAITDYINSLRSEEYPQVAEIAHILRDSGISLVHLPMELNAYYLTEHLRIEMIGLDQTRYPSNSLLIPEEDDSLKFTINDTSQISLKTCCWYTNEDLIDVEVGE